MGGAAKSGQAGRPLKVGVWLPTIERTMAGETPRWTDIQTLARVAEDVGFDSLWMSDHLIYRLPGREDQPVGIWECWSLLAALAATTQRVQLGPFVSCIPFRNPALLAKMAETVDEISGGRLILGLGAGWHEPEFRNFGYPLDHRAARFQEAFTIIHGLLTTGKVDYEGRYYQVRECELRPRGPRPNGVPIMIGSNGPRVLRMTVPYVAAWNSDWTTHPSEIPPLMERVDAACRDVGRDPAEIERTAAVQIDLPIRDPARSGRAVMSGATAPGVNPVQPATGDADELAELLRGYAAVGISHVQLWLEPATTAGFEWFASVLERLDRSG